MGHNPAVVGRLSSIFLLPPQVKVSFIYDDQDKDSHRFVTIVPGGHGDPLADFRYNSHLRFAAETAMVQQCCYGDLWRHRLGIWRNKWTMIFW